MKKSYKLGITSLMIVCLHLFASPPHIEIPFPNKISSAHKFSDTFFPCELKNIPSLPTLTLIGEIHDHPLSQKTGQVLFELSARQKALVGIEGVYSNEKTTQKTVKETYGSDIKDFSRVRGFDHDESHGLSILMRSLIQLRNSLEKRNLGESFSVNGTFCVNAIRNSFIKARWKSFIQTTNFLDEDEKRIVTLLSLVMNDSETQATNRLLEMSLLHPWYQKPKKVETILNKFLGFSGEWLTQDVNLSRYYIPKTFRSDIADFVKKKNQSAAFTHLAVDWRNQFLVRNIAKLYCEAQSQGLPLYIMVGESHLEGVQIILQSGSEGRAVPIVKNPFLSKLKSPSP